MGIGVLVVGAIVVIIAIIIWYIYYREKVENLPIAQSDYDKGH